MIKIYKYNPSSDEYQAVVNDPTLKGNKRETVLKETAIKIGEELSIKDYFSDVRRDSWNNEYGYIFDGEPENVIERLVKEEIDYDCDLCYCSSKKRCPEDLVESRTDWDVMKSYADGLYCFIESLKSEIAQGTIIAVQNK